MELGLFKRTKRLCNSTTGLLTCNKFSQTQHQWQTKINLITTLEVKCQSHFWTKMILLKIKILWTSYITITSAISQKIWTQKNSLWFQGRCKKLILENLIYYLGLAKLLQKALFIRNLVSKIRQKMAISVHMCRRPVGARVGVETGVNIKGLQTMKAAFC